MGKVADAILKSAALTQQGVNNFTNTLEKGRERQQQQQQQGINNAFTERQLDQQDRQLDLREEALAMEVEQRQTTIAKQLAEQRQEAIDGNIKSFSHKVKNDLQNIFPKDVFPESLSNVDTEIQDYYKRPMDAAARDKELHMYYTAWSVLLSDPINGAAIVRKSLPNFPAISPYRNILERLTIGGVDEDGNYKEGAGGIYKFFHNKAAERNAQPNPLATPRNREGGVAAGLINQASGGN